MSEKVKDAKPTKSGARTGTNAQASSRPPKPKGAESKANASGSKRLRPGELDGLVLSQMRTTEKDLPASPSTIAKAIGRSSGAVGNCLERLVKAKKVRRAKKSPRAYDLKGIS